MHKEANQRIVLCDLNWTRLDNLRFALAQFFDHPASHHRLAKISKVRIDFAPGFRSTAILFVGWLGAQLNWHIEEVKSSRELRFTGASARHIDVDLRERNGEPVHEVALTSGDVEFRVTYAHCGDLLEVSRIQNDEKRIPQLMPAGNNDPVGLISEELIRGGPHRVYLNALNCVRDLTVAQPTLWAVCISPQLNVTSRAIGPVRYMSAARTIRGHSFRSRKALARVRSRNGQVSPPKNNR